MKATHTFLICADARTGSNLLAATLRRTRVAGQPWEFFGDEILSSPQRQTQLEVPVEDHKTDWPSWLEYVADTFVTTNGVFGTTLHPWHIKNLLSAVSADLKDDRQLQAIQAVFPDLRFIRLRRIDKIAQAISHCRARQSGVWQIVTDKQAPPQRVEAAYDFLEIDRLVSNAIHGEEIWRNFFDPADTDRVLQITYEDLNTNFEGTIRRVLDHLGVTTSRPILMPLQKQSGSRSLEWAQRYRREKERNENL